MKRTLSLFFSLAAAAAALPREAGASDNAGVTAAPVLQIPIGARAIGMGGAFTGLADDVSAMYYNPAGLGNLNLRELSFMHQRGIEDQSTEYIAFASPLPTAGLVGSGYSTLGASLLLNDNGMINVNQTKADGSFLNSQTISAGGDMVATLGYAERVLDFTLDRKDGPYNFDQLMGVNAKFIRSTLAQAYSAESVAGDVGFLLRCPELGSSLGLALMNFGTKMRFLNQGDPLPLTLRGGFALKPKVFETLTIPPFQSLTLTGDAYYLYYERQFRGAIGVDYTMLRNFSFRLGYQVTQGVAGMTMGFGAGWRGLFVDYAWAMSDTFGDTHRFSFTYRFGKVPQRVREQPRRPFIESMPEREELKDLDTQTPRTMEPPQRPRRSGAPEGRQGAPGWIY